MLKMQRNLLRRTLRNQNTNTICSSNLAANSKLIGNTTFEKSLYAKQCFVSGQGAASSFFAQKAAHEKFLAWKKHVRSQKREWEEEERQRMEKLRNDHEASVQMVDPPPLTSLSDWRPPAEKTISPSPRTYPGKRYSVRDMGRSYEDGSQCRIEYPSPVPLVGTGAITLNVQWSFNVGIETIDN